MGKDEKLSANNTLFFNLLIHILFFFLFIFISHLLIAKDVKLNIFTTHFF